LVAIVGSSGRASEILAKKRALSIDMIRAISKAWKLPLELLIQPYKLKTALAAKTMVRRKRVKPMSTPKTRKAA